MMHPTINRVILKEVKQVLSTELQIVGNLNNKKMVICYEVLDVGPEVQKLAPGMHCLHISAAGDKIADDIDVVREEDVIAYWYPPEKD